MEDASPEEMKAVMDRWSAFGKEAVEKGAFIAGEALQESSTASLVRHSSGEEPAVTDGPFTESKELVASYALFEVKTMDEAVMWTRRFLEVLGQGECELRPIFDPTDFSPGVFPADQAEREAAWRKDMDERLAKS